MLSARTRLLLVASLATTVACGGRHPSQTPQPQSSGTVATGVVTEQVEVGNLRDGIEQFVPAFAANDSGGVCRYLPPEAREPGVWVASLDFPSDSQPTRRVTVRYDTTGALTYYADLRGDMTLSRVVRRADGTTAIVSPTGRRTLIDINVTEGFGLARNVGGGGAEESYRAAVPAMLEAASLGHPARMAALVRARCG